ncbi:protein-tyrosine kinase 2-beta [Platysternon megacephalum]|uniref:Protein-tyrosine kinase 2-beta n=1 Tax=Platysternon megacephalum TaxID=55544 RepID=A0A4D9E7K4_9SAUR|nr:protein-tyrosine kinase 2-beta [Platysternon megacephalum]
MGSARLQRPDKTQLFTPETSHLAPQQKPAAPGQPSRGSLTAVETDPGPAPALHSRPSPVPGRRLHCRGEMRHQGREKASDLGKHQLGNCPRRETAHWIPGCAVLMGHYNSGCTSPQTQLHFDRVREALGNETCYRGQSAGPALAAPHQARAAPGDRSNHALV